MAAVLCILFTSTLNVAEQGYAMWYDHLQCYQLCLLGDPTPLQLLALFPFQLYVFAKVVDGGLQGASVDRL